MLHPRDPGDPLALTPQPSAAARCTQSRRATSPAWSTPGPTPLTCAATTASGWSGASPFTSSSWSLLKSMTTSKCTAPMTSSRYNHPPPPKDPFLSPHHLAPLVSLLLEPLAKGQGRPYKGWVGAHESGSDLRLKTYTKQDSTTTISQVPRLKPRQPCLKKCPNWRNNPPSSPIRSTPMGRTWASSVGIKGLLTWTPAAMPWICSSLRMSRGTAGAGSCTTPLTVSFRDWS